MQMLKKIFYFFAKFFKTYAIYELIEKVSASFNNNSNEIKEGILIFPDYEIGGTLNDGLSVNIINNKVDFKNKNGYEEIGSIKIHSDCLKSKYLFQRIRLSYINPNGNKEVKGICLLEGYSKFQPKNDYVLISDKTINNYNWEIKEHSFLSINVLPKTSLSIFVFVKKFEYVNYFKYKKNKRLLKNINKK